MAGVGMPSGPGAHPVRTEGVIVLGRHPGLVKQAVEVLSHEGFLGVGVISGDADAKETAALVARGADELRAVGRTPRVLVVGTAVPQDAREDLARSVEAVCPGLAFVEHHGSLQRLFEEVLEALALEP